MEIGRGIVKLLEILLTLIVAVAARVAATAVDAPMLLYFGPVWFQVVKV
jgi:hypothetical protein